MVRVLPRLLHAFAGVSSAPTNAMLGSDVLVGTSASIVADTAVRSSLENLVFADECSASGIAMDLICMFSRVPNQFLYVWILNLTRL
ncbi:hypothetical protein PYCCODRAFT_1467812 [Trametes coccinea BRFM310]|uniref:Uncharacterized protein n=1 Tax=Trametes coccinea (strain BRFM310) TaxID=1353009 RepID=A0A1Y2IQF4_TRAC3|nr:hypothetical protein PYCCODRAFT_1467812 [Trametes coccinea BRFM310]